MNLISILLLCPGAKAQTEEQQATTTNTPLEIKIPFEIRVPETSPDFNSIVAMRLDNARGRTGASEGGCGGSGGSGDSGDSGESGRSDSGSDKRRDSVGRLPVRREVKVFYILSARFGKTCYEVTNHINRDTIIQHGIFNDSIRFYQVSTKYTLSKTGCPDESFRIYPDLTKQFHH